MNHRAPWTAFALLLVASLAPVAAHAQEGERGVGLLSQLHYGALGGVMAPVGPQGAGLSRGPFGALTVVGESSIGMQLGVEGTLAASNDVLRTRFVSLGAIARLSPMPDDYRAYIQLGAGLYSVSYSPKAASAATPGSTVRPGGSFGVGVDLIQAGTLGIGGLLGYHGVVLGGHSARSYLIVALNLTLRPSGY